MARRGVLRGDKQLRANIRLLREAFSPQAVDDAIEHALQPLVLQTEANARKLRDYFGKWPTFPDPQEPRRGGHLDEGVRAKRMEGTPRRRVWWVAMAKRARKLAHLVEFGTAPHWQPNFAGGWQHPGARPHPFFRPAFETKKHTVLQQLRYRIEARLLQTASRLRK